MSLGRICAAALLAAVFLSAGASAQVTTGSTIKAKEVHTKAPKPSKTHFQVVKMMPMAIQVQNPANEKELHTFAYSDQIRVSMQTLLNHGGYQYGDKVVIEYMPGTEVALKIKGKPSKPV